MPNAPARFLCSYGGNNTWLEVDRHITFEAMMAELNSLGGPLVASFKYHMPGEDPNTLVTVENNRDLGYFMREYDLHCNGSASSPRWMRIFLDTAEQRAAVDPPSHVLRNASDEDRSVKIELEGHLELWWGRFGGRASFSLPGPLTTATALLHLFLILLLTLPISVLLQKYPTTKADVEFMNLAHHDRLIPCDKSMNQVPGSLLLEVPAKDEYTIEMVLHDKKGSRMHASVPKALVKKFCPVANMIQNGNIDYKELIDISVEVVVGNEGRQIVITLEDMNKNRVSYTLFGTLVDHIFPHLDSIGLGPLIVELHIVRAKSFSDNVHVQSSYYASKLHVNVYIKEDVDFKNRLVNSCQITSQQINHLSSLPKYSVSDEINSESVRVKSIVELLNCENEGSYWILASIVRLDVGKDDWFYKGCTRCHQKLQDVEPFYCKRCDRGNYNAPLRFRLQVIVSDGTGSMTLVLWDREAMQLVGKTATEIIENSFDDDDDADTYPKALDSVIDTKLLIEIVVSSRNINDYDGFFNVTRISDDEQLIAKFGLDAAVASRELEMQGIDNNVSATLLELVPRKDRERRRH